MGWKSPGDDIDGAGRILQDDVLLLSRVGAMTTVMAVRAVPASSSYLTSAKGFPSGQREENTKVNFFLGCSPLIRPGPSTEAEDPGASPSSRCVSFHAGMVAEAGPGQNPGSQALSLAVALTS